MSNPGQPMDPVMALAAQQAPAPAPYYPAGDSRNSPAAVSVTPQDVDPVEALAAGNSPTPAPQPQAQDSQSSGGWADPAGYASSVIRNAANAATFNLADPLAAATGALFPVQGYTSTKPTYGERYDELLKLSRGETAEGQKAHPYVSLASSVAGGILNPANTVVGAPATLGRALIQGGALGAGYGVGGSIGNSKDLNDAAQQTAEGAGLGMAGAGIAQSLGRLLSGAVRTPEAQLLADEGVRLTPGQSLGGTAHTLEDASTHIPMLGNAIKGRQTDAMEDFNRAFYNRALQPLGIQYDRAGPIGNEGIGRVGDLIGQAYTRAYTGAAVPNDPALGQALQGAVVDASHNLAAPRVAQIQNNIDRLITLKMREQPSLIVSRKVPNGNIVYGKPGDVHSDLFTSDRDYDRVKDADLGFSTAPGNPFMSRAQAFDWVSKNQPNRTVREYPEAALEGGSYNASPKNVLSGDDLINAKNWFAEQSRSGPTASLEDRATAQSYGNVLEALKDGIRRSDPRRGALLDAADEAYSRLVPVQQAAGLNASSGRGGVFTAPQIGQALRSTDLSVRRGNFARGTRDMQDLAQAGQAVLPSTVPDSGTALRGLLELGAGGAITHEISPEAAITGAGLIGSGTALYSRPGQALARALLHGAPGARTAMGAIPQTMIPGFVAALTSANAGSKP